MVVWTKKELASSIQRRERVIVVEGELAKWLRRLPREARKPLFLQPYVRPILAAGLFADRLGIRAEEALALVMLIGGEALGVIWNEYVIESDIHERHVVLRRREIQR